MASEASHITHEAFGEIRAGGSSLARPRADLLVYVVVCFAGKRLCAEGRGISSWPSQEMQGVFRKKSELKSAKHLTKQT